MDGISTPVNLRAVVRLHGELTNWLRELGGNNKDPEKLREGLTAMAEVLQTELSVFPRGNVIPHARSMELLMRAVAHDLAGSPVMEHNVKENLDAGYGALSFDLSVSLRRKAELNAQSTQTPQQS